MSYLVTTDTKKYFLSIWVCLECYLILPKKNQQISRPFFLRPVRGQYLRNSSWWWATQICQSQLFYPSGEKRLPCVQALLLSLASLDLTSCRTWSFNFAFSLANLCWWALTLIESFVCLGFLTLWAPWTCLSMYSPWNQLILQLEQCFRHKMFFRSVSKRSNLFDTRNLVGHCENINQLRNLVLC